VLTVRLTTNTAKAVTVTTPWKPFPFETPEMSTKESSSKIGQR
jgi:hypothetical protein